MTDTRRRRPLPKAPRLLVLLTATLLALFGVHAPAAAQDDEDFPPEGYEDPPLEEAPPTTFGPPAPPPSTPAGGNQVSADFSGTLQILRAPAPTDGGPGARGGPEIFPDARKVFMSVRDTDPIPVETARRGGKWLCSGGQCTTSIGDPGPSKIGDEMLRSIKLQTPALPLPLTIWGRIDSKGQKVLDFDPVLLGRRSYAHVFAYKPVEIPSGEGGKAPRKPERVQVGRDGQPAIPTPDSAELTLGLQWPRQSEMANFKYIAIVDTCGNARVQPFQRTFTVPVFEVATGGCGPADGKVLRVFPGGGWIRVTAFNLDATAASNVVNATYRVSIPPLENLVESNPAKQLFPDLLLSDLKVDCGPVVRKAPTDAQGIPAPPPGVLPKGPPPGAMPPPPPGVSVKASAGDPGGRPPAAGEKKNLAGQKPSASGNRPPAAGSPPPSGLPPRAAPPPPAPAADRDPSEPGPVALDHQSVIIAPEPLRLGNCRLQLVSQTKRRLVAPLSLWVSLSRTDRTQNGAPIELLPDGRWIITSGSAEFPIPPLAENFDGDSRLKLAVYSEPLSADGKVVLLSDAGRVASSLRSPEPIEPERARRLVGSVTIHSVPLCGEFNFETLDAAGNCLRAYVTIPAMLATLQVTRAPWLERPLVTRSVLSAIGVAVAFDSYNPVERKAFPVAGQVGGFVQSLGDGRIGILGYLGIAPTIPVLGTGGNTTSFGFLAGVGLEYITNEAGPDEGLKPAAFLSVVVQVGQASPEVSLSGKTSLSAYGGE
ncbi:MAG TPA: hypothetical protein VE093_10540 [Polyangiaceae bacterium]|jgi:hypothetical protein|nr:hypothetical protein [Polyangiaceae bacterium]